MPDLYTHPVIQEHFAPAGKTVAGMLREKIAASHVKEMLCKAVRIRTLLRMTMPHDSDEFELHFEDLSAADAAAAADDLRNALLDASPDVKVDVHKADPTTMDFGATLILVLGTPAILAIAKGIAAALGRERAGTLVIKRDGNIVFKGNSSDAAKIAESLGRKG